MLIFESTYLDDFNIWGPSAVALLIDLSLTIELLFSFFFFFVGFLSMVLHAQPTV